MEVSHNNVFVSIGITKNIITIFRAVSSAMEIVLQRRAAADDGWSYASA